MNKFLDMWNIADTWEAGVCSVNSKVTILKRESDEYNARQNSKLYNKGSLAALTEIFSHFRVNPSKTGRSELIKGCHTFINESKGSNHDENAINFSVETLNRFINTVIKLANHSREQSSGKLDDHKNITPFTINDFTDFCIGEKGVGKTHLQNYILSKYSEKFDQKKIIYVRLNLLKTYGDPDVPIMNWIEAQATKVICRYYGKESDFFTKKPSFSIDYIDNVNAYLDVNYNVIQERVYKKGIFNIMRKEFNCEDRAIDINPGWVDSEICSIIWDSAVEAGFTFVVLFDGLDQLTGTYLSEEKKKRQLKQMVEYLSMESTPKNIVNLVFLRDDTFEELLSDLCNVPSSPWGSSREKGTHNVAACPSPKLYASRMDYLLREDNPFGISFPIAIKFDDFYKSHLCGMTHPETKKEMTHFEATQYIAEGRPRMAIQLMRTCAIDFLRNNDVDNNAQDKAYLFTESAMFCGLNYPPRGYTYSKLDNGLQRNLNDYDHGTFDVLFFPSVFTFPHVKGDLAHSVFSVVPVEYLMGIRLLQIINVRTSRDISKECLAHDVIKILNTVYGYNAQAITYLLEEYNDFELIISSEPITGGVPTKNLRDMDLKLSTKGNKILHQYIFDLAYISISALTLPTPYYLINSSKEQELLFKCRSPRIHENEDWVIGKIINGFSMMKLISWINDFQKNNLNERNKNILNCNEWDEELDILLNPNSNIYNISKKLKNNISLHASKTIDGIEDDEKREYVKTTLHKFFELKSKIA